MQFGHYQGPLSDKPPTKPTQTAPIKNLLVETVELKQHNPTPQTSKTKPHVPQPTPYKQSPQTKNTTKQAQNNLSYRCQPQRKKVLIMER
jgi:hypothetical protein